MSHYFITQKLRKENFQTFEESRDIFQCTSEEESDQDFLTGVTIRENQGQARVS